MADIINHSENGSSASESEKEPVRNLPVSKKIQMTIALMCTLAIVIGIPTFAWFSHQRKVAELQQVREPDLLYITSANAEDIKFFDLSSIKVKDSNNNPITEPKYYPFGVAGKYVNHFTLQMAHTTNNPFIYKIYEGTAYTTYEAAESAAGANGVVVEYKLNGEWETLESNGVVISAEPTPIEKTAVQTSVYIVKGDELDSQKYGGGHYLNDTTVNGRKVADNTYHTECYGDYSDLIINEEPLFWQCTGIPSVQSSAYVGHPFFKTFLLEISWTAADVTADRIDNNKETDIVYLFAFRK
ncbi:MAG: hypothetical protein IKP95_04735 [Ruminococcus sp.]|nr:hypothetical protein [Ruminococcus sp.]